MPGVGLMVRVVGLGSEDPEFKSHSAVEIIPGGVDCLSSFRGLRNECQLAGRYPVSEWRLFSQDCAQ